MKNYVNPYYKSGSSGFRTNVISIFKTLETLIFLVISLIFLVVTKINDDVRLQVSEVFIQITMPVVEFTAFPVNLAIDLLTDFNQLAQAKIENKQLKKEIEELRNSHLATIEIARENDELRKVVSFVSDKTSNFKVVKITASANQIFKRVAFINAGKNQDIKEGQLVVSKGIVIGRIHEVLDNRAKIILINDSASKVPVISSQSAVRGILAGNGSNLMNILYLPQGHNIKVGEAIFTSGDGETLPSGFFIGLVVKVAEGEVTVATSGDIAFADIVSVVEY